MTRSRNCRTTGEGSLGRSEVVADLGEGVGELGANGRHGGDDGDGNQGGDQAILDGGGAGFVVGEALLRGPASLGVALPALATGLARHGASQATVIQWHRGHSPEFALGQLVWQAGLAQASEKSLAVRLATERPDQSRVA